MKKIILSISIAAISILGNILILHAMGKKEEFKPPSADIETSKDKSKDQGQIELLKVDKKTNKCRRGAAMQYHCSDAGAGTGQSKCC
ncbi:hypothetical protein KAR34_07800 [bacterium]|nr:hypothetical protein [bacterium]